MMWPSHQSVWQEWRSALQGKRMHHGWILAGKEGLGKRDFAHFAARALVSAEAGAEAPSTDDSQHPDILHLTYLPKDDKEERKRDDGKPFERKRNITVGQIREMQKRLTTRPTLGDRRAVIIDPADDMEKSASNALLKSLEEPPQGTFFILIAHRPSRLLPTIRSRCRVLRFPRMKPSEIEAMLIEEGVSAPQDTLENAIRYSGGSPGVARDFLDHELGPVAQIFEQLAQSGDAKMELRGALAKAIGTKQNRDRERAILSLAQTIVAKRMESADPQKFDAIAHSYNELVTLANQAPTYNFDARLLALETGSLIAKAAKGSA